METGKIAKSPGRLDEKVILTMIITTLLALAVLAFRYKTYTPCAPAKITIISTSGIKDQASYYVGDQIQLSSDFGNAQKYEWQINDKKGFKDNAASPYYHCSETGTFIVTLKLKGNCESYDTIVVTERPVPVIPKPLITHKPENPKVGDRILFEDTTTSAETWEWDFGEPGKGKSIKKNPGYMYKNPGTYTVTLRINADPEREASVQVIVGEAELKGTGPGGGPPPPQCPVITEPEFISMMLKVVEGKTVFAESFTSYMNGNTKIPVILNNINRRHKSQHSQTFDQVCKRLKDLKSKKINKFDKVVFQKNSQGCITGLTMDVDISAKY